uniref:Uncharacterized protein n=1 Tax=Tetranychus urticae TaxID=32264 RepID=T1KR28_TETUR
MHIKLSSCSWGFPWKIDEKEESSTEKTTEKSFKDGEPNSSPQIDLDYTNWPRPKDNNVLSSDNNEDESTSGSSVQSTITTPENVAKTSTQAFDEYLEEESSKFPNSEKEIKWIPITSTKSTDKIVNYVSSVSTQITDSSTPTTEKATEMSFKGDEPNSSPGAFIQIDDSDGPQPKIKNVIKSTLIIKISVEWSSDDNEDECSRESSVQQTKMTLENVSKMPNEEFDEKSLKSPNSEKKIKSMPTTSTDSSDKIVSYVSSTTTQITDSSTPTTEESESESSTTDNTNTSTTTENTLNDNDDVDNVPRIADEDKEDSKDNSSVVSSSTISSSFENFSFENEVVSNSSEFMPPEVSYAANDKDISSWIDEEKEPTSDDQQIGRKDKETHSSRNVTDYTDYSTQKITENIESERSSTDMTNTPTITENTLNYASNVRVARSGINSTESYDNDKKRGALVGSGSTGSFFGNFTLNFCVFLGDLLFLIHYSRKNMSF